MPTQFAALDTGFPTFTGKESTEEKVEALHSFTYMLLEYLRYILRNLGPENLNEAEMKGWLDGLDIKADTVISNTIITNELYSEYGAIADLTVDELRTDYMRAARYMAGNTTNLDYIHIHDEEINFITGKVKRGSNDQPLTEQLHHGSRYFYWTDAAMTQMTSEKATEYPVIVYQYDEARKGRFFFTEEEDSQGNTYKVPVLKLGQGSDAGGVNSTGRLIKHTDGLELSYTTEQGDVIGIWLRVSGYMDLYGLRKTTRMDFSDWDNGSFSEDVDGSRHNEYAVTFDGSGRPVKITDGDGHETEVLW